jgi:MYXO-CTERM domain-containing protein
MTSRFLSSSSTFASTTAAMGLLAAISACGDSPELSLSTPSTTTQAVAQIINVEPATQTINEGSAASVTFAQVCVSNPTAVVTIQTDFADPNDPTLASATISAPPGGEPCANDSQCDSGRCLDTDAVPGPDTCDAGFPNGACGAQFDACDSGCAPLTHVYADNLPGNAARTVVASAFQADAVGTIVSQNLSVTVLNVAPDATLVRNNLAGNVEGRVQNHTATVADPGDLPNEIATVLWTFVNPDNVADPTTVDCTCDPNPAAVTCVDEDGATIVGAVEPLCANNDTNTLNRTFLQGPAAYVTTITITDKDGASDSAVVNLNTINEPPQAVSMAATNLNNQDPIIINGLQVSSDINNPTEISEGFNYRYTGTFTEAGIDTLTINWDLNLGVAGGESTATNQVTKESHPAQVNLSPANGLTPTFIHNDDDDNDPSDIVDRTLQLIVADSDGGSNQATRFVRVVDVDPIVTNVVVTNEQGAVAAAVNEGSTLTFTATAISGARDRNSDDPIDDERFDWFVANADAPAAVNVDVSANTGLAQAFEVVSGCGGAGAGVTELNGVFTSTCTIRFLDDDAPAGRNNWQVSMRAHDEDSGTTTAAVSITVNNVLPTIQTFALLDDEINEAETATVRTTGTDPAGVLDGDYRLTVTYTESPANLVLTSDPAGSFNFADLSNLYEDNDDCQPGSSARGTCDVTAVICENLADPGTPGARCSLVSTDTLGVSNVAPTAAIVAPAAPVGGINTTIEEGTIFALDGQMSDVAGQKDADYAIVWTVEGGDILRTVSTFADADTEMDATAIYQEDGNNQIIRLVVTDEDGGQVTVTRTVNVDDNDPIIGTPILTLGNGGLEPTGTAQVAVDISAQTAADLISVVRVAWGDGTAECYTGAGITGQGTANSNVVLVKGSGQGTTGLCTAVGTRVAGYDDGRRVSDGAVVPTFSDLPFVVQVTVFDEDSSTDAPAVNANVQNVVPTFTIEPNPPPGVPVVIAEGTAAAFVLTAQDVSLTDQNAGLIAEINWGDGSTPDPEIFTGTDLGTDTIIRAPHVFTNIGAFTVTFTIVDKDGGRSAPRQIIVEVVNLAPILTDLFTTLPVTEGIEMSAVALVDNRGLDPLVYNFDFDCGTVNNEADIIAAFAGIPNNVGGTSGVVKNTYTDEGDFTVCVRVCDDDNADNSCVFGSATLEVFNQPSVLNVATNTPPGGLDEGGTVTLTATASDIGADDIDIAFDCDNDGTPEDIQLDVTSASFGCEYGDNGVFTARVTAFDGVDLTERTVTIIVNNVAPTVVSTSATPAAQAAASTLTVAGASDVAADRATLVTQYDVDLDGTFDIFSNAANGQATFRFPALGNNGYSARVCDKDGACSAPVLGTAVVTNVAPTIQNISAPSQVAIGAPATVSVVASDVGNDTLNYTFSFAGVGPTQVVGPQQSAVASASFAATGRVTVSVSVNDGTPGPAGTATGTIFFDVVEGANENPSITLFSPPAPINEGGSVTLSANAIDAGNDTLTFTFDCEDDGVILPANIVAGVTNGTASTTCSYAKSGSFVARVTVTDPDGGFTTQTTLVRVLNLAPELGTFTAAAVDEGQTTLLTVIGSTDAGGDAIRIEYDTNNDGAFDIISDAANGAAQIRLDGDTVIGARACDNEGACSATQTVTAVVRNVAPVIVQISVPSSAITGAPVSVNVTATDAGNDPLLYTFTFTIGDTLVEEIGPQASPFATASFGESGAHTVQVTVTDGVATVSDTASFLVTDLNANVVAVAEPATINEGQATTITVTPTTGVGPFDVSYDMNGDGDFNDAVDIIDRRCDGNLANPCTVTQTFAQNRANNLAFRVLVSVTDRGNNDAVTTAIVAVEVRNVAPTLNGGADATVEEQADFERNLAGQETDPGDLDTHTFSLVSGPAGMTVSSEGLVEWTPDFADEGENDVVVRVTDSDGASGDASFVVTVTIIDENDNDVSDTQERLLNGGELLPDDADVTDTDGDGISDLDEVLQGTDPAVSDAPGAPVVISPNGVTVNTLTPTLTVANAFSPRGLELTYTFVVSDSDGTEVARITGVEAGETTTSAVVPGDTLTEQGKFSWVAFASDGTRNLADDADIEGATSDAGTFTVDAENEAPGAPDALTPANDSAFLEGTFVTLEARAVVDPDGDAVTYVFEVASDDAFGTIVATSEARAVPVFTLPEALAVGSYFWHAKASDGELESDFGTTGTFSVAAIDVNVAPLPPTIVSPSNESIASTSATLTISAGSDPDGDTLEYEFELADNAAFANPEASGAQAGLTFAVSDLGEDIQYFWRARSFDGALVSDWVNATFVVDAQNGAPAGLAILSPNDGALLLEAPTAFTATEAVDPEGDSINYQVVVSESDDFASPVVNAAASVTGGVVRLAAPADLAANIDAGKTYFWKVTASDGTNEVVAAASFSIFAAEDEDPSVGGGGCGCNTNEPSSTAGVFAAALALLALRRRRR